METYITPQAEMVPMTLESNILSGGDTQATNESYTEETITLF